MGQHRGRGRWGDRHEAPRLDLHVGLGCLGGLGAAWILTAVIGALVSMASAVLHSPGLLFVLLWAVAGVLVYRKTIKRARRRKAASERERVLVVDFDDDDHEEEVEEEDEDDERERGRPGRVEQKTPDQRRSGFSVGEIALSIAAGFGMALAVGLSLLGVSGGSTMNMVLLHVMGFLSTATVYLLVSRHMRTAAEEHGPSNREVVEQAARIRTKARRLSKRANKAGGVFRDLDWQAKELSQEAGELSRLVVSLRRTARETKRGRRRNPTVPVGVSEEHADEDLRRELDAAKAAQSRLDDLLARNRRYQDVCITQLERIEDLMDGALLEVAQPVSGETPTGGSEITQEVETGLQAAREALAEVERDEEDRAREQLEA